MYVHPRHTLGGELSATNRPPFGIFGQGENSPDIDMLRDFFTNLLGGSAKPTQPKSPRYLRLNGVEYCKLTDRYDKATIGQLMSIANTGTLFRLLPPKGTKVQVKRLTAQHFEGMSLSYLRSELDTYYVPRD